MTRSGLILCTALGTIGVGYPAIARMPVKLVWNASASAPIGFYTVDFNGSFEVGDLVVVSAPETLAVFLAERGYLPKGVPLVKRVLAVPGQTVCRTGLKITVGAIDVGAALERDRAGRDLPIWQGCQRVSTGELFLMNWQVRDSLDGRYFGLTSTNSIIGRAVPLWTDEEGYGHFQWRAPTR
ncbi:conjugative transfer signal peptidase TraF [Mesorhizobium sp. NFR06]|uniref:S26 family signal peptidase n=1 Tax=Mesorhizobium sp. NFR06 TaxID=1566290 RepID=UPI0008EEDCDC|nr:S26 family signal peptidase [Mesorhizobium sp. NFR06]SFO01140.1 conjugative transfer signal peptidase TraF [Mesorhizobium sp. NFR06]